MGGDEFAYGNGVVTANVSLNTWNPTEPTTYYQIGSQLFILSAYLEFNIPAIGPCDHASWLATSVRSTAASVNTAGHVHQSADWIARGVAS